MFVRFGVDVRAILECQVLGKLILTRELHCTALSSQEQGHTATDTGLGAHTLLKLLEQDWLLADYQELVVIGKNDRDPVFCY